MGTIDQLKAKIKNGVRTNRIRYTIYFPSAIAETTLSDDCEYMIKSGPFPGKEQGTVEAFHQGESIKLAGDNTYPDLSYTIYLDNETKIHKALLRWMEFKSSSALGIKANDLSYKSSVKLELLDNTQNVIRTAILVGAHPMSVGEIQGDHESKDELAVCDVTFAYDYCLHDIV